MEWWKSLDPAPPVQIDREFPLPNLDYPGHHIDMVLDYLYITDIDGAESIMENNSRNFTCIITLLSANAISALNTTNTCQGNQCIEHHKYTVNDDHRQNMLDIFRKTSELIDTHKDRGGKVLVHCMAGMSRSASVVLAYLITKKRIPLKHAYNMLLERRPCIYPNEGFIAQLKLL